VFSGHQPNRLFLQCLFRAFNSISIIIGTVISQFFIGILLILIEIGLVKVINACCDGCVRYFGSKQNARKVSLCVHMFILCLCIPIPSTV
jgi:hypothetical protein